jgi:hypothetical protein
MTIFGINRRGHSFSEGESRRRGHDDRKLECLGSLREADDVVLELSDRVIAHSAHESDLVVNEDKCGVFGCERLVWGPTFPEFVEALPGVQIKAVSGDPLLSEVTH